MSPHAEQLLMLVLRYGETKLQAAYPGDPTAQLEAHRESDRVLGQIVAELNAVPALPAEPPGA